jgi:hypothetical protein
VPLDLERLRTGERVERALELQPRTTSKRHRRLGLSRFQGLGNGPPISHF